MIGTALWREILPLKVFSKLRAKAPRAMSFV